MRRLGAGVYETLDGRYLIEHQDNYTECEHPLCETLHRRFHESTGAHGSGGWRHLIPYVSWHVWDVAKDDYAFHLQFDTLRDARAALDRHLAREEAVPRKCPDDGACHHACDASTCFRVAFCGPLSDVYPDDEWPESITERFGSRC